MRQLDREARSDPGRHLLHRDHAAPSHHLGEARIVGAEQLRPDGGADAVGADHGVGFDLAAIGKARHRDVVTRRRADAILAEMDDPVGQRLVQDALQVGAMRREIGRSVFGLGHAPERSARAQARVIPGDRDLVDGLISIAQHLLAQAKCPQHLHPVRPDLDAGADLLELRRTLVDLHLDAALVQRVGGGKATDACADDGNTERPGSASAHAVLQTCA